MTDIVSEIKSRRISEVVSRFVVLQNAGGARRKGKCPFHREKTPSFYIDDNNGFFHCFGCGEGGDVISFIQKIKSCDFLQALDVLCDILAIDKKKFEKKDIQAIKQQHSFYETMNIINDYYSISLCENEKAQSYLKNTRLLNDDTIKEFSIGVIDNDLNNFCKFLSNHDVKEEMLLKLGFVKYTLEKGTNVSDKKYLFFRNRIMIPIHDQSGRIVGFGGRIYNTDEGAKYLNSPESDFFKKGSILFNFHRAKKCIDGDKPFIIVEGYMDVIALWQAGLKTAIAPLGTSITNDHLQKILNYCKTPVFIFDSDTAGVKASIRACEMLFSLLQTGFVPRFCTLNGAKDVDEFLKKYQVDSLKQQINLSVEINEFIFSAKMKKYNTKNPNDVAKLEKELLLLVDKIKDKILQKHYRLFFQKKIWELKFQAGFKKNKDDNKQHNKTSSFENGHTSLKTTNINDKERRILAFLFLNRDFLINDELNENIIPKFIKRNQKIFEDIATFDFENDSNGGEIIGSNYIEDIKKIQTNSAVEDIFKNLIIGWELEYLKTSNIPENIKQKERKKILEKKENMLSDSEN